MADEYGISYYAGYTCTPCLNKQSKLLSSERRQISTNFLCQKLSKLMEIWRSSDETILTVFFWDTA